MAGQAQQEQQALGEEQLDNWRQQVDEVLALAAIFEADFTLVDASEVLEGAAPAQAAASGAGAEGGAAASPGSSSSSNAPREQQEQRVSAEALSEVERPASANWALELSLLVHVELPCGQLNVVLGEQAAPGEQAAAGQRQQDETASTSGQRAEQGGQQRQLSVRHLPPIRMTLRLGPAYPSQAPPALELSCLWLSRSQAAQLEAALAAVWEEQAGAPVAYYWADWLGSHALSTLGAEHTLILQGSSGADTEVGGEGDRSCCSPGQPHGAAAEADEATAAAEAALVGLLRFDAAAELRLFQQSSHTCAICFEEKLGREFGRLDCGHHAYCLACLGAQTSLHVGEGSLEALRCPHPGCGAALAPDLLRRLLPAEQYERWESLTLQRTLDMMQDAAWCPRCSTVAIEDSDNCAQCPRCLFVFCSLCSEAWHPGSQCVSAETKLAMLRQKLAGGGRAAVADLRRREQELASLAQIEKSSKRCPTCGMAVQKSEGCNKMTCGACGAFFCYKCGKAIRDYSHFRSGDCVLFDEAEVQRWEAAWDDQVLRAQLAAFRQFEAAAAAGAAGRRGSGQPSIYCPSCGQVNYKRGNNNHMACWACTTPFCYLCRAPLRGRGGSHFGPGKCRQHSEG